MCRRRERFKLFKENHYLNNWLGKAFECTFFKSILLYQLLPGGITGQLEGF